MSYPSAYGQSCTLVNPAVLYAGTNEAQGIEPLLYVGQVLANSTYTIPEGAQSWSFSINGVNGTVNGVACGNPTVLSGANLLPSPLVLVTTSATTINYSFYF